MPDRAPKPADCALPVEPLVLAIVATLRWTGKGMRMVIGNGAVKAIDNGLVSLIAREIATRNMLLAGRDHSIDAMAAGLAGKDNNSYNIKQLIAGGEGVRLKLAGMY